MPRPKVPEHVGNTVEFSCTTPRAIYTSSMVKPAYQPQNAACAIMLCEGYLGRELDHDKLDASLMGCPTPGRFDVLGTDPLKLIDACHNPQSCENFVSALDEIDPCVENRPTLLCAAAGRQGRGWHRRRADSGLPRVVVTQTDSDRALPTEELAALVDADKLAGVYPQRIRGPRSFRGRGRALRSSRHHYPSRRSGRLAALTHPLISCGEIGTVLWARSLKQSVFHRNF